MFLIWLAVPPSHLSRLLTSTAQERSAWLGAFEAAQSVRQSPTHLPQTQGNPALLHPSPAAQAAVTAPSADTRVNDGQRHANQTAAPVLSRPTTYSTCPDNEGLGPDGHGRLVPGLACPDPQEQTQLDLVSSGPECSDSEATTMGGSGAPENNIVTMVTRAAIQQIHLSLVSRHEAPAATAALSLPPPRTSSPSGSGVGERLGESVVGEGEPAVAKGDERPSCPLPLLGGEDFDSEQHVMTENDCSEELLMDSNFRCDDMSATTCRAWIWNPKPP